MNLKKSGNSKNRDTVIDLTSMVDVVFLLIIFFLITTTFKKEKSINLDLAKSNSSKELKKDDGIVISIDRAGKYYFMDKEVSEDKLKDILKNESSKTSVLIKSDKNTKYKYVVKLMGLLQEINLTDIDFITE
jgi:biopolymer transport protein ExbD